MSENERRPLPEDFQGEGHDHSAEFLRDLATSSPPKDVHTLKAAGDVLERIEAQLRHRAYELWEEAGKPDGRHNEFWLAAEAELVRQMHNNKAGS